MLMMVGVWFAGWWADIAGLAFEGVERVVTVLLWQCKEER